ncbi:TetR/AcrR family transcriptional regulator [Metabacillus fastidiosus]|uniref:TetR/AcrR family transcriptional regulator n=1 Tax=Metabacillus fastidiosus TaxID=1458 RepID=UPI002DBE99CF|nr:TetR/AcrR family transcriptional regulator [Metabacillus fastidiosus]MEC2074647.1 TetR/AcrR family transcriptional regulator [Metabacillus fastidiosus]
MQDRIIDEVLLLIQQKGVTFTISELAKNLGTSKRTIYEHFTSKDYIIEVIIDRFISQIKEKEKEIAEREDIELLEKIEQILCFIPKQFQMMEVRLLADLKKHHFYQWEKLDHFLKKEWSVVIYLMEQAMEEGIIRNINLQLFIELYLGVINQIYNPTVLLQNQVTFEEKLEAVMDILLYGISTNQ